jgi:hypothetical protein
VLKKLCPQKVSGSSTLVETQSERTNQSIDRVIAVGAVVLEIAIPALATEAVMGRYRFQPGGLSGAVLAREKTNPGSEGQFLQTMDNRNRKRVALSVHHSLAQDCDLFQQRKLASMTTGGVRVANIVASLGPAKIA